MSSSAEGGSSSGSVVSGVGCRFERRLDLGLAFGDGAVMLSIRTEERMSRNVS